MFIPLCSLKFELWKLSVSLQNLVFRKMLFMKQIVNSYEANILFFRFFNFSFRCFHFRPSVFWYLKLEFLFLIIRDFFEFKFRSFDFRYNFCQQFLSSVFKFFLFKYLIKFLFGCPRLYRILKYRKNKIVLYWSKTVISKTKISKKNWNNFELFELKSQIEKYRNTKDRKRKHRKNNIEFKNFDF